MREVVVSALFRPCAIEVFDGERHGVGRQHPSPAPHGDQCITSEQSADADQDAVAAPFAELGEPRLSGEFPPPDHAPLVGDEHFEDSPLLSALMREG